MRSYYRIEDWLTQHDCHSQRKRKLDTHTQGEHHMKKIEITRQGTPKWLANHREPGDRQETD